MLWKNKHQRLLLKNIQKKDDEVMADCKDKKKKGANIG
jgi:hypothetical protein